jgi:hypothetical protein
MKCKVKPTYEELEACKKIKISESPLQFITLLSSKFEDSTILLKFYDMFDEIFYPVPKQEQGYAEQGYGQQMQIFQPIPIQYNPEEYKGNGSGNITPKFYPSSPNPFSPESPKYQPTSPPTSPPYVPQSPKIQNEPFQPKSPDFIPQSPQFPQSPQSPQSPPPQSPQSSAVPAFVQIPQPTIELPDDTKKKPKRTRKAEVEKPKKEKKTKKNEQSE